jgi:hypothetical protein
MDQREYTRIECDLPASLLREDAPPLAGRVRDISFAGAHLEVPGPPAEMDLGPGCRLELVLPEAPGPASGQAPGARRTEIDCWLVYVEGRRVGLRFTGAEEEGYQRLRAFLLSRAPDPDRLREEVAAFPNPVFPYPPDFPRLPEWIERILGRRGSKPRAG